MAESGIRPLPGSELRPLPTPKMWPVARFLIQTWLPRLVRMRVYGLERMPATGPVLLAANHVSYLDIFVLGMSSPRIVYFMAKKELFKPPILRWIMPRTGAFPVDRGAPDRGAIEVARDVLRAGEPLGIYIEGTRKRGGDLGEVKPGVAMIAAMTDAPVIPVCIYGTGQRNPLHRVSVVYGEPLRIEGRGSKAYAAGAERIAAEIRHLRDWAAEHDRAGRPRHAAPPGSSA